MKRVCKVGIWNEIAKKRQLNRNWMNNPVRPEFSVASPSAPHPEVIQATPSRDSRPPGGRICNEELCYFGCRMFLVSKYHHNQPVCTARNIPRKSGYSGI